MISYFSRLFGGNGGLRGGLDADVAVTQMDLSVCQVVLVVDRDGSEPGRFAFHVAHGALGGSREYGVVKVVDDVVRPLLEFAAGSGPHRSKGSIRHVPHRR